MDAADTTSWRSVTVCPAALDGGPANDMIRQWRRETTANSDG